MVFNIAIIGAGPSGCMLARLLHISQHPKTPLNISIFESELSPDYRAQGGTLDLHEDSGLRVMREAGLYDEFLKYARYDGAALKLMDKTGKRWLNISASTNGKPEIDRAMLRKTLYENLPDGMVKWGKKLVAVDGEKGLMFADGTREEGFDLIIGGDGAWSKTRKYLDDETVPIYSGVTRYWSTIADPKTTALNISKLVNRGSIYVYSDGKAITSQQLGSGNLDVAAFRVESLNTKIQSVSLDDLQPHFADWTPELQDILKRQPVWTRAPLYELPVGYNFKHKVGVTLLGDSAHLMTPFAGEGVNLAFEDAMMLAQAILGAEDTNSLDTNIRLYEQDMTKRATKAQAMTIGMKEDMLFTEGAPKTSIESWLLRRFHFEITGFFAPILYPMVVIATYTFFFFQKLFM